ncbi:N-acetylmuramic acid 6-phosphate etherase [Thalassococcus lentus]|uniref:N-acetylmuramic acid 6-phosphate etherase n=1 Tax=Thalassococcus lentus TaxID=1210524 RepID=A0ABT4XUM2_9RHOB|nr:N-acetylmuramic acid 6-phosphate etherase [Thalassococcus lentus]MDA7425649.1 N-acetylmuramic acid 6-phosphate etherase [Thalassococcus lentus]
MNAKTTEHLHDFAIGLDQRAPEEIASLLAGGQLAAAVMVQHAISGICAGAKAMAQSIRVGGCLHYVAAGSSGLMAAADAQELGGTFSIPAAQLRIHMAGGLPTGVEMPGDTEDDTDSVLLAMSDVSAQDTIIAVSASGSTPYTVAAAERAKSLGASVIGIANNAGSNLLNLADHAVLLETPPEVLSGSTRMGAGTAQKIALNMLSTLMAVDLGHVHDGMMVNLRADNIKLRHRASGIVSQIAGVSIVDAGRALDDADGDVKTAVLIASRGLTPDAARVLLNETAGHLRPAMGQTP